MYICMQQLKVEHKNTIKRDYREGKGRVLAISHRIYRLQNTDVFYVESESSDNTYYFVKFKPDLFEYWSCLDNSMRGIKCKHLHSIEYAIRLGTLRDTDKLPVEAKRDTSLVLLSSIEPEQITTIALEAKSYTEDDYSF